MSYDQAIRQCQLAAEKSGRTLNDVKILAVSKLQPVEKIKDLYSRGHRTFAENYVQEAMQKQADLKDLEIEWHLIGSLQKNKVKHVVGKFELIHAVDSLRLAAAISKTAAELNLTQKILLQVNVAGEESKSGFLEAEFQHDLSEILKLPNVAVMGLMTMPPLDKSGESVRPYFAKLRNLKEHYPPLKELSMGTSQDYHIAIEEGATIVRLGTVLFGERAQDRTQR